VQASIEKPIVTPQQQMSDAGHDRELLLAQMAERDTVIVNLAASGRANGRVK